MFEEIEIEETENLGKTLKGCVVDLDKQIKAPDTLLYYGFEDEKNQKRVPALTRGEFSCIVAQSKTKKSFNKSLIEACFLGGKSDHYTDHIKRKTTSDGYIVSIDTEQGEYYAFKTFERTRRIAQVNNPKYIPLQMRKLGIQQRLDMIDYIVFESEFSNNIDLLVIDGVADLVYNTNDIKEGVLLAEKLLQWSSKGNLHLITVIHKTGSSDKARGHLGTAIQFKAETIILMDALRDEQGNYIKNIDGVEERNTVKVRCGMSRGKNFNDFYLRVDEDGLPFTFNDPDNPEHPKQIFNESKPLPMGTPQTAFSNTEVEDEIPF